MADDYTPPIEDVRNHYAYGCGPEHTWQESREDFDRFIAALHAEWEAELGETYWEYGCKSRAHVMAHRDRLAIVLTDQHDAEEHGHDCPSPSIVRRRRAGRWEFWLPVTNTESEG